MIGQKFYEYNCLMHKDESKLDWEMEFQVCTIGCTPFSPNTKYFMRVGDPLVQERNLQEDPSHRLEVCRDNLRLVKRQMLQFEGVYLHCTV